jgi:hypothetical protein
MFRRKVLDQCRRSSKLGQLIRLPADSALNRDGLGIRGRVSPVFDACIGGESAFNADQTQGIRLRLRHATKKPGNPRSPKGARVVRGLDTRLSLQHLSIAA